MGLDTLAADRGVAVSFSGPRQSKNSAKISPASVRTRVDIDASPGSLVGVYPHRAQVRSAPSEFVVLILTHSKQLTGPWPYFWFKNNLRLLFGAIVLKYSVENIDPAKRVHFE
ncbi:MULTISPECIES: hypothetical protein [unclassified Mesorhizobium]|uniref:hypothetical protein n=1 Tax=unclassified Mesorhizobium TaxID=325217 RepID=UPI000FD3A2DE|nr:MULTISPECIES: hypothetical protein [unclassified Mesorhizobium]RUU48842.1 hypothetical protein EOD08_00755 [Mesorhizobium sp. M6A.T.Ca.TU.002.02.2.1]RVB72198.1 hypothetical protein EN885_29905 [Mesorhizobium sp. M6A.T.Cr.TU.014.01.1.1]RWP96139.1 MAG: hypothetical protein EOR90_30505 [Mesorhizobium sp.]RWP98514.1 MAG: hypothetical protein EOR91_27830 [Mesorhizobium sp.]